MSSQQPVQAVNPLPVVVIILFAAIVAVEIGFQLGARGLVGGPEAVGWRLAALQRYAFSGDILRWMWDTGQWPPEHLLRFVSYPFIHVSFTQALFSGVMLLALGKMVAETCGALAMLAVFFVSSVVGALAYAVFTNSPVPLVGAFPPVYGLIGAFTYLLWLRLSAVGENQARAFTLIGFLMGIQLIFAVFIDVQPDWVADLGGFAAGFALTIVLVPGGWARLLARLRRG